MNKLGTLAPAVEFRFAWQGVTATGTSRRGILVALDTASVRRNLRTQNIVALHIERLGRARAPKLRETDVTQFSRQLCGLLQAGIPLLQALELIATSHTRAAVKRVVAAVAGDIAAGSQFSTALERYPRQFGPQYCQLLRVGEASGALPEILTRLADQRERGAAQRARLRAALTYPICILVLAILITGALMIFVVPTFKQIFEGVGMALPTPTRLVLAVSDCAARYALPVTLSLGLCCAAFPTIMRRSPALRAGLDRQLLKLPVLGELLTRVAVARWSRALATLLQAGVPLSDSFDALVRATGNRAFDDATQTVCAGVRQGQRLATAMKGCACFPDDMVQALAVAEESGALDVMLSDLADLNDRQADQHISGLSSLAEPFIIVILGLLIGSLVIAMYLPIIDMGNTM